MDSNTASLLTTFIPIVILVAVMYFLMIRPQNKKEKQAQEMRNSIEVGDAVVTIGGLVGRVASIKEDTFMLETGSERVKIRMKRWAIQSVEKLNLDGPSNTADAKKDEKKEK